MHTIIIADTHTLCREALSDYIRHIDPHIAVSTAESYQALRARFREKLPDLILMDRSMLTEDPPEKTFGEAKIGIFVEPSDDFHAVRDDVEGVFLRNLSCKAVLGGINDMLANRRFFPREEDFTPVVFRRTFHDFNLTVREKEVMTYLVKGASNKDIARALDLQVVTVKLHVRGICRKLNAANRTQAALIAKENGWG